MKLTHTQKAVLDTLQRIRREGEIKIEKAQATAIGGLTAKECNEYIGVYPNGSWIGNYHIKGANIRSLMVLATHGLVRVENDGIWIAN